MKPFNMMFKLYCYINRDVENTLEKYNVFTKCLDWFLVHIYMLLYDFVLINGKIKLFEILPKRTQYCLLLNNPTIVRYIGKSKHITDAITHELIVQYDGSIVPYMIKGGMILNYEAQYELLSYGCHYTQWLKYQMHPKLQVLLAQGKFCRKPISTDTTLSALYSMVIEESYCYHNAGLFDHPNMKGNDPHPFLKIPKIHMDGDAVNEFLKRYPESIVNFSNPEFLNDIGRSEDTYEFRIYYIDEDLLAYIIKHRPNKDVYNYIVNEFDSIIGDKFHKEANRIKLTKGLLKNG